MKFSVHTGAIAAATLIAPGDLSEVTTAITLLLLGTATAIAWWYGRAV